MKTKVRIPKTHQGHTADKIPPHLQKEFPKIKVSQSTIIIHAKTQKRKTQKKKNFGQQKQNNDIHAVCR